MLKQLGVAFAIMVAPMIFTPAQTSAQQMCEVCNIDVCEGRTVGANDCNVYCGPGGCGDDEYCAPTGGFCEMAAAMSGQVVLPVTSERTDELSMSFDAERGVYLRQCDGAIVAIAGRISTHEAPRVSDRIVIQ